jgi:hypothetical protein
MIEATAAVHSAASTGSAARLAPRLGTRLQVGLVAQQAKASSNAIARVVPIDPLIAIGRQSRRTLFF